MNPTPLPDTNNTLISQANLALKELHWASNGAKVFVTSIVVALLIAIALLIWYAKIDGARKSLALAVSKVAHDERLLYNSFGARYESDASSAYIMFNPDVRLYTAKCEQRPCVRFYINKNR